MQGQLKNKQARFIIARQGLPQTLVEPKTGLEQKSLYICSPLVKGKRIYLGPTGIDSRCSASVSMSGVVRISRK